MWCLLPLLSYALRKGNCRAVQEVTRIFLVSQEVLICSTCWFHRFRSTLLNVWGQRSWEDHFNYTCHNKGQMLAPELPTMLIFLVLFVFWNTWCFLQAMLLSLGCAIRSEAALSTMKMGFHLHLWWLMKPAMCEYNWICVVPKMVFGTYKCWWHWTDAIDVKKQ